MRRSARSRHTWRTSTTTRRLSTNPVLRVCCFPRVRAAVTRSGVGEKLNSIKSSSGTLLRWVPLVNTFRRTSLIDGDGPRRTGRCLRLPGCGLRGRTLDVRARHRLAESESAGDCGWNVHPSDGHVVAEIVAAGSGDRRCNYLLGGSAVGLVVA